MAARECPQCGEPLMGAVNRCWKCGIDLRAETRPGAPPVSRTAFEPLVVAELVEEVKEVVAPPVSDPVAPPAGAESPLLQFGPNGSLLRRGSPFATGSLLLPPQTTPDFGGVVRKTPSLQQAYASNGGAVAALVLGIFGVCLAPIRFEGAIVGIIGLVMGLWGLYSQRRGWALVGLILCCFAIAIGMYTGVFWLFQMTKQANPWEY